MKPRSKPGRTNARPAAAVALAAAAAIVSLPSASSQDDGGHHHDRLGPQGIEAHVSGETIVVEWDAVAGATAYQPFRAEGSGFTLIATTEAGVTSFTDADVEAGVTYHYVVNSLIGEGETGTCSGVEITAVPVFSSPLAVLIATAAGVGAFVYSRRRSS